MFLGNYINNIGVVQLPTEDMRQSYLLIVNECSAGQGPDFTREDGQNRYRGFNYTSINHLSQ